MASSSSSGGGIGLSGILGTIFIVLKLTNTIDWKWVWVLAPFWGGMIIYLIVFFGVLILVSRDL